MQIMRMLKHLAYPDWWVGRRFPDAVMNRIEAAVTASETSHLAEIRFAVEASLPASQLWRGITARQRALAVFGELGVWDTAANNGVLVYLLLADRDVEIVADRGFNGKVEAAEWTAICTAMEQRFAVGEFEAGVLLGIERIQAVAQQHFPASDADASNPERNPNELPNRPVRI